MARLSGADFNAGRASTIAGGLGDASILGLVALAGLVLTQRGKKAWALSVFLRIVSLFTVTLFGLEA